VTIILAYKIIRLIITGKVKAISKGIRARDIRAIGLNFISLVYIPLI
jgi:hypothetical protein